MEDHGGAERHVNTDVRLQGIVAVDCKLAVTTWNDDLGHSNLSVRNVTAQRCGRAIKITHTDQLTLTGLRVEDHPKKFPPVTIGNCDGVTVRDVTIAASEHEGAAMELTNSDHALVDGLTLRSSGGLSAGLVYRLSEKRTFSGLRVSNVYAPDVERGIVLSRNSERATLVDYAVSGNVARVVDRIRGRPRRVEDNFPEDDSGPDTSG